MGLLTPDPGLLFWMIITFGSRVLHLGEIRLPGDTQDGGGPESIY